ncbi:MAG TPA: calcium-binding protein [Sphingomicrobium sp.]|nr:calcium-binding protein [Sphingomicrobium sp.]
MAYIKILGSGVIKLTGSYGYNISTVDGLPAYTTIDATGASWIVSNSANQYPDADTSYLEGSGIINRFPFIVYSAGYGLTLKGGSIWGQVPQTSDWQYTYNDSAALRIAWAPAVTVDSWRIDKAWDAIRILQGSTNFLINDVHLSNIRDDAVENEYVLSGTIRDSLFDGVFSGISLGNSKNIDGSTNTVTLQNSFIRMETYLANGEMTHGTPIKANTDAPWTTPDIRIINSVIAIEDPTHNGFARLKLAWDNVVESYGNVFLNLSDTPLPTNYPLPPAGFTILQGQAARDYWAKVEAAWLANHDGVGDVALTPLPAISVPAPAPAPTGTLYGTIGADTLIGTAYADRIDSSGGSDLIYGKGGRDTLIGGTGQDKFVFDTALDGSIDELPDFNPADDTIYLDNMIFTRLTGGTLSSPLRIYSGQLVDGPGAVPKDSNDFIIYDKNTGNLSYDSDGNGPRAGIIFAHLPAGLDLTPADFYII